MTPKLKGLFASLALLLSMAAALPAIAESESDRWRIIVNNDAATEGTVVFRFHPLGAYPFEVSVHVAAGTPENDIADRVRDVLQAELPQGGYELKVEDGEKVVVEASKKAGHFNLVLLRSDLTGVEFTVED